jgi:predicted nucleic acid-binding protein
VRAAVGDTSPFRYLVLIGAIDVLPRLFETVFVPNIVHAELCHTHAPAAARSWAEAPPVWLSIVSTPSTLDTDLRNIDAGERAAIALATEIQPDLVLIDERAGVAAARARALKVTGTIGLRDRAAQRRLIDLPAAVTRLKATNFRYRQELLDALLAQHRDGGPERAWRHHKAA